MGWGDLRASERKKSSDFGTLRQVERSSTPSYTPSYGSVRAAERSAPAAPTPTPSYTPSDMAAHSNSSLNSRYVSAPTPTMASVRSYGAPQVNTTRDAGASAGTSTYRGTSNPSSGYVRSGSRDAGASAGPSTTMANVRSSGVPPAIGPLFPSAITPGQQMANAAYQQGQNPFLATAGGLSRDVVEATGAGKLLQLGGKAVSLLPRFVPTVAAAMQRGQQAVQSGVNTVQQGVSSGLGTIGQAANRLGPAASNELSNIGNTARNVLQTNLKDMMPMLMKSPAGQIGVPLGVSSLLPTTSSSNDGAVNRPENIPPLVNPSTESSVGRPPVTSGLNQMGGNTQINTGMSGMGSGMVPGPEIGGMTPSGFTPGGIVPGAGMTGQPPEQLPEQPVQPPPVEQPLQPPPEMFNPVQYRQEIDQLFGNINTQNAALMTKLSEQLLGQLNTLESDLKKQYEQQGSVIDPATQAALKEMRAEVDRRRQGLMEEMNRRGLLQSGIWLEEENRILGNQLNSEEKLLAGRVADIQNRMTDALMKLGQERINTMGQLAQNQMQTNQWTQGQQINAMNTLNSRNDQWNQWWQGQLANQRKEVESTRQFNVTSGETARHNQATEAAAAQKAQTRQYSDSATSRYIQQIPTYPSLEKALAEFQQFRSVMEGEKADTQRILNTIYAHFGGQ